MHDKPAKFFVNASGYGDAMRFRLGCGHNHLLGEAAMRVVHVRVSQADFGEIIGAMRAWVDRNNCWLERFETEAGDGGSVIIKAQFTEDDLAALFRHEFQGNYGD
jgi:hypothetical protein